MRQKIVAGNWKMNNNLHDGLKLASEIVNIARDEVTSDVTFILCPPFVHLHGVNNLCRDVENVFCGAQNCHQMEVGAYTGEISAEMIKSCGAEYVIIGHSERREYFNESDDLIAAKVNVALKSGLRIIFCCGEPLSIREDDGQATYVENQISNSLFHLPESEMQNVVIAYEPIWAIGTGVTASADQAQEMHAAIRNLFKIRFGEDVANEIPILYGGSVNPDNSGELFGKPDVDGGLIGGASLDARSFISIAKSFQ